MSFSTSKETLQEILVDHLDRATAQSLCEKFQENHFQVPILELLGELKEVSSKIHGEAIRALGEMDRRGCLNSVIPWLDLGITFAQASGALGLRYFKESPLILGLLENEPKRTELLTHVLELADGTLEAAPQCAYEWLKVLPQLWGEIPLSEMQEWARLGMELAEWNYVLGNEFFRESPAIVRAIPMDSAKAWIGFGMKLMVQNQFGKPDYIGTLEFFRTSPRLFLDLSEMKVKQGVIDLGSSLADQSPEQAVLFLTITPEIMAKIPTVEWKIRILQFGLLVADRDPAVTLAYFGRVSEVVAMAGKANDVFDAWFRQGMDALEYSADAGKAFFGLETRQAFSAVEQAMSGVPLRQVARTLKMFARALCGKDVALEGLPEQEGSPAGTGSRSRSSLQAKAQISADGQTIYLPLVMRRSEKRETNQRWYTVMVAHEVGHLEFGTYALSSFTLQHLTASLHARYHRDGPGAPERVHTLGNLFQRYPQPGIIRDLWEIIEDARIDFLLRREYPGLQEDLTSLTREAIETRSFSHGMTAREIVLDALLLLFAGFTKEDFARPGLQEVIDDMWEIAQKILQPTATADDSVKLADRLYLELERRIGTFAQPEDNAESASDTSASSGSNENPEAAEQLEEVYQPVDNWGYRGILNPDHVIGNKEDRPNQKPEGAQPEAGDLLTARTQGNLLRQNPPPSSSPSDSSQDPRDPEFGESPMQQWLQHPLRPVKGQQGIPLREGEYLYEEWDGTVRDYRPHWCRVVEQPAQEGSPEFVAETFQAYGPIVRLIRRYFETIRPEVFRRMGRQSHGEDIDLDALVNWMVDRRKGQVSSDQIYSTRQKRDRQVAVAFLVDMSGSTGRQVGSRARPVIDIEKEGLLLLSEALSAIGDEYAMYGFSGKTRQSVDIHVLKDFHQGSGARVGLSISGIKPRQQNRDGAAIRHATLRLMQQAAKVRLLILLSDGKPLDDDYADEYSLEDTKMALREASLRGVHPFCITIDQAPTDYVRRMYGDIGYIVVDEVDSLPTKLPKIYQRLTAR